jgi:hypothetical protein
MPPSTQPAPSTLHDRRMAATAAKLRAALDRLVSNVPERPTLPPPARRLTVAALAREAGVARNAIYTNHREILDDLAQVRTRVLIPDPAGSVVDKFADQRAVISGLQIKLRQLATENAGLLQRAVEAERLAERANHRNAQLAREIDALRRPTLLHQTTT